MKAYAALCLGLILAAAPTIPSAHGESLVDALVTAYGSNPTLLARRAELRGIDEGVPQALSGWRPTLSVSGEGGVLRSDSIFTDADTIVPRTGRLSVDQPLFRGGRTVEATRGAESRVLAGRERLRSAEQDVLLQVITAYADVLRDHAVVELTRNNERVLARQFEATQDRFEVGELTRTDVAQSEARLSGANSDRGRAEGDLIASRATYRRAVGVAPQALQPLPPITGVPASEEEAAAIAEVENPELVSAAHNVTAAVHAVREAAGALLPTLSLNGELSRAEESFSSGSRSDRAGFSVQLTAPLYQAGSVSSRVRQARQVLAQRRRELDEARRGVTETVTQAWEALGITRLRIRSATAQIRANEIALDGVREEASVGARTILDVLDAEQELLDSRVSLVLLEREEFVAAFQLRRATGQLTARHLGLPVQVYDPVAHYDAVRDKWFGFDSSAD